MLKLLFSIATAFFAWTAYLYSLERVRVRSNLHSNLFLEKIFRFYDTLLNLYFERQNAKDFGAERSDTLAENHELKQSYASVVMIKFKLTTASVKIANKQLLILFSVYAVLLLAPILYLALFTGEEPNLLSVLVPLATSFLVIIGFHFLSKPYEHYLKWMTGSRELYLEALIEKKRFEVRGRGWSMKRECSPSEYLFELIEDGYDLRLLVTCGNDKDVLLRLPNFSVNQPISRTDVEHAVETLNKARISVDLSSDVTLENKAHA